MEEEIYGIDKDHAHRRAVELIPEGKIDAQNKPLIQLAIDRQKIWAELAEGWGYKDEYVERLNVLERVLKEA